jgi:hypothetical protein
MIDFFASYSWGPIFTKINKSFGNRVTAPLKGDNQLKQTWWRQGSLCGDSNVGRHLGAASAGRQWTHPSTVWQKATTQPKKVLILTMKLWHYLLFH